MKLAILVGAGASFGAGSIAPYPPPLGAQLFDELSTHYPDSWGALLTGDEIKALTADPPFESGMALLRQKNDERLQLLLTDMALYFTKFRPSGPNQYLRLLQAVGAGGHQAVFCSLNYECVLELVAQAVGMRVDGLRPTRLGAPYFPLLKPHGSCNYVAELMTTNNVINLQMSGNGAFYQGPLAVVGPDEVERLYRGKPGIPPALSLYAPGKESLVASDSIGRIREDWAQACQNSHAILTIGVRPVLQDVHIWEPIERSSAAIWFVGGADPDFDKLRAATGTRLRRVAGKFDEAMTVLDPYLRGRQ